MKTSRWKPSASRIRLGEWVLDPSLHCLLREGRRVPLRPKLVEVLVCLCERPGAVLPREEILSRVWDDAVVTEDSLTRAVSELRAVLGDDPAAPRYIETIRKGGYRLVAPVNEQGAPPDASELPLSAPRSSTAGTGLSAPRGLAAGITAAAAISLMLASSMLWLGPQVSRVPSPEREAPAAPSRPAGRSGGIGGRDPAASNRDGAARFPSSRAGAAWSGLPRPVTSYPGRETDATLSRDGARVAFAWSGPRGDSYDIYVKSATGSDLRRLTDHPDPEAHPAWSPDGRRIAFVRWSPGGARILEVDAGGGRPRHLAPAGLWATGLDWSPGGDSLVYSLKASAEEPERLALLSLDSLTVRGLTPPGGLHRDWDPAWSPDGGEIAFVRGDLPNRRQQICILPAAGGDPACHATDGRKIRGLDWAGHGRTLILAAGRGAPGRLFSLHPADGRLTELKIRAERITDPSLSGDGRRLIYESADNHLGLWRLALPVPGRERPPWERVMASTHSEGEAVFSPDGRALAFVSSRSGSLEIWITDGSPGRARQLTRSGEDTVGRPRWSPGGRRLAYQQEDAGATTIRIIPAGGGAPRTVLRRQGSLLLSGWSAGGEALYFGAEESGGWSLWRLPAGGGEASVVISRDAVQAQESPDGRWLYFSGADRNGIWRMPRQGGLEEQVAATSAPLGAGAWTLAAGRLFLAEPVGGETRLASVDPATRQERSITRASWSFVPALSVSPDGRSLLVSRTSYGNSDIMMIEDFDRLL